MSQDDDLAIYRSAASNLADRVIELERQVEYWRSRFETSEAKRKANR